MRSKQNCKTVGAMGENVATSYLIEQNYKILFRNWKFSHLEVDIIASIKGVIVFIEVKSRISIYYGAPQEAVDDIKINNLLKAAEQYIYNNNYNGEIRFDIISIKFDYLLNNYSLEHIQDAFF